MIDVDKTRAISTKVFAVLESVETVEQLKVAIRYSSLAAKYLARNTPVGLPFILETFQHGINLASEKLSNPRQLNLWSWYEKTQQKTMSMSKEKDVITSGGVNS